MWSMREFQKVEIEKGHLPKALTAMLFHTRTGKYNWQAFGGGDGTGPSISPGSCVSFMTTYCAEAMQQRPLMMGAGNADNATVAAFLIVRPPIGYPWRAVSTQVPSGHVLACRNIPNLDTGE